MPDPENILPIYVCSSNRGKLRDFSKASEPRPSGSGLRTSIVIEPLSGLSDISPPEENGTTFEQNAAEKALYYSSYSSGLVLADDSGLEVDALAGAPGVHSARYAGAAASDEANNRLLLRSLAGVTQRQGRFVCVLALARERQIVLTVRATVAGTILTEPKGHEGFGYDPLFFYPPLQCSFGELTPDEKSAVSHRGQALRQLFQQLRALES